MRKNILVVLGHPNHDSFCDALSRAYLHGAQAVGHNVRFLPLGHLKFDPLLRHGYSKPQALEPDLVEAQHMIRWAEHLVFIYPIWWGAMPALLKGFIDRTFLPGFAFKYRDNSLRWDRLLSGRSAHLLVTMDTPPWYFRWIQRMPGHQQMKRIILEFWGIHPVTITNFGPIRGSSPARQAAWLARAKALGHRA